MTWVTLDPDSEAPHGVHVCVREGRLLIEYTHSPVVSSRVSEGRRKLLTRY